MTGFQPRTYRLSMQAADLTAFRVVVAESDLHVQVAAGPGEAGRELLEQCRETALEATKTVRREIAAEIALRPEFATSLEPIGLRPDATETIARMTRAAHSAGVGPMAAVAGAVAEFVARRLSALVSDVIVENGGDLYIITTRPRTIAVFAGDSPLSNRVALQLPGSCELSVCTSSGTVGHSKSFGKADAALIASGDGAFADAAATALGNRVTSPQDIEAGLEWAASLDGVRQALIIVGSAMGVWGEFEIGRV